ncbi:MAG: hypothetical protein A3J51_02005 [Omnitrophica WOR_2 bacterium RIFCSPHIGHO2_02_FULL_45_21]|nr:MAG: hypothetical protein A3J51_02005 [Omnitrophica WOR_2 bacterium RIFCSPHIGHO2_02_FULL_45_21]
MRKGFTLIELVVVLIIVAILGTLGLTQYTRLIEKARGAEAKMILGSIRQLAAAYYMENYSAAGLTNTLVNIGGSGGVPGPAAANCATSHYFWYTIASAPTTVTATATRCIANSKPPNGSSAGTLILTSTLSTGVDSWTGNGGYN